MKKYMIISGSILFLFVLCTLTFQPVIAVKKIEFKSVLNDINNFDRFDLRELHSILLNIDDCDCKSRDSYPFFICWMLKYFELSIIFIGTLMIIFIPVISYGIVTVLYQMVLNIMGLQLKLGCEFPDY